MEHRYVVKRVSSTTGLTLSEWNCWHLESVRTAYQVLEREALRTGKGYVVAYTRKHGGLVYLDPRNFL